MGLCYLKYGKSITCFLQVHNITLHTASSNTFCCGDISAPLLHAWLKF